MSKIWFSPQDKIHIFIYFLIFHSFIPLAYKRSLVSCLLPPIFNLFSSYENFYAQLEVVRKLLNFNGFPSHTFNILFGLTSSNVRPLFTHFLGKLSISAFPWGEGFGVTNSITDRTSFNSSLQIISSIHELKKTKDVAIALVGNKKDLEHFRSGKIFRKVI